MRSSSSPFPSNQSTPKTSLPMELQFQQHHQIPVSRPPLKSKNKTRSSSSSKFVGVRQRPSGRWVAEIKDTTKKIRMWLGTFESPEEAARAYDAAACLLRGSNTRTNFASAPDDSPLASRIRNLLNLKKQQKNKNAIFNHPPSSTSPINSTPAATLAGANTSSSCSIEPAAGFRHESQRQEPRASQMDEEACRPCFGDGGGGEELEFWNSLPSSLLDYIEAPPKVQSAGAAEEISEFERMKVERQLSASLYAFNGVQEYLDMVYDPSDPLWDLPPLCHLSCRT